MFYSDITFPRVSAEDDLSEMHDEAVPEEVRMWLAATFAKQEKVI